MSVVADGQNLAVPLAATDATNKKFTTDTFTLSADSKIRIKCEKEDGTIVMVGKKGDVQTDQHAILPITVAEEGNYKVEITIDDNNNANILVIPAKTVYSLAGTMNGWGDTDMVESVDEPGTFTAEITLEANGEFKVKFNHSWDINLGGPTGDKYNIMETGTCTNPTNGGGNFTVAEAGTYVVTLIVGENDTYTINCAKKA